MGTQKSALFKQNWFMPRIIVAMEGEQTVDEEKIIADFCFSTASTRKTALEILKNLESLDRIVRKDGKIWTIGAYEADMILKKSQEVPNAERTTINQA